LKYDKPLFAAFLGILSTIPYELLTRMFISLGFGKYSVYQLSSLMVTLNRPAPILGFFISVILSCSFATLLYYALKKLGTDYLFLKGTAAGSLFWLFLETFFTWLIEGPRQIPTRPISDYYIHILGASLFGFTTSLLFNIFLFKKYSHQKN
jgi:hypothetical protein